MTLSNDRLLRALRREEVDRTPIWIMRQAGRYLPEYRETRARAGDFLSLCKTPELACEVSLQPVTRYPLDAAIIFSDILVIPDAMGLGLGFRDGEGPFFARAADDEAAIASLTPPPTEQLEYVYQAIHLLTAELDRRIPIIGFAGSPWTLASYMVEGQSPIGFTKIKKMLYDEPKLLQQLLSCLTEAVANHLCEQIKAGADCVMIFDTWGGVLPHYEYLQFSLTAVSDVVARVQDTAAGAPIILFTRNGGGWLEEMAASGVDALGLDWTTNIRTARQIVGDRVALQGNLDPSVLLASEQTVRASARRVLDDFGGGAGHIFNLGHGIHQQTEPERLAALIDEVHSYGRL